MLSTMSADCELSLHGLSKSSVTRVSVRVEPKKKHGLCDCSLVGCQCCDGFDVNLTFSDLRSPDSNYSLELLNGTCSALSCESISNTNGKNGEECACEEGYVGNVSFNVTRMTGNCSAAPCNFFGSNNQSGSGCKCGDGFAGEVEWRQSGWKGHCYPAKCDVSNSNQIPGLACKCLDGFQGKITWNGSNAWGTCTPAPCQLENSNQKPGIGCRCADGFDGEIDWEEDIPTGPCYPAKCDVSNSNRKSGLACRCNDGFKGKIMWNGSIPTGKCTPAPCNIDNSNKMPGPRCRCADGFDGDIAWEGDIHKGSCKSARCSVAHSTRKAGWKCRCDHGFPGNITWNGSIPTGTCTPAPCNTQNSNEMPGLRCRCKKRYTGWIFWIGPKVKGLCEPAACVGKRLNGKPGLECRCADGHAGKPLFKSHSVYFDRGKFSDETCTPAECPIPNSIGKGPACRCADKFVGEITWKGALVSGECFPAACNFPHSNNKPGPECACAFGYEELGEIHQEKTTLSGICEPIPCVGDFSNHQDGPGCRCADGYNGSVQLGTEVRPDVTKLFSAAGPAFSNFTAFKADSCLPAKCAVANTTGDGKKCRCKDGYQGSVTWIGPNAVGACKPAHCSIENSNGKPGLECRCLDGYEGSISWKGEVPSGTCTILPCRISDSDFAEGPFSRCLKGFYGAIKWTGQKLEGECLPTPMCSQNIIHATSLARWVEDGHGNFYDAGEQMVLYGHECGHQRIQWTSALPVFEDARGRRTRWSWAWDNTTCGRLPVGDDEDKDSGSIFAQMPPLECSIEAAEPRCDSEILYRITSQDTAPYTCPDAEFRSSAWHWRDENNRISESSVAHNGSVLQYYGRQCGYDLMLWESVMVELPTHKCLVNLSLSCGEIPDGMHLPRSCKHIGMPATFIAFRKPTGENAEDGEAGTVEDEIPENYTKYVVKFFENGEYSVEGVQSFTLSWHNGWMAINGNRLEYLTPDEKFVSVETPRHKSSEARDGRGFIAPDGSEHLIAVGTLPAWWTFKFQPDEMLRGFGSGFDIENLDSCHLHFFLNGTCYEIWVGLEAKVSHTSDSNCPTEAGTMMEKEPEEYYFEFSTYTTQTFRSESSCSSLAAHRELQFEVVDLRSQNASSSSSSSASFVVVSECRIALRLAVDVSSIGCHSYDSYVKEYG